jgi:superfamily II DNA or RNA helicase
MRYTLKDYQEDAVGDVLDNLRKSARDWKEDGDTSAFSLTATTGAGKTVMAAAVIESLFDGNPQYNFEPDPGAAVLWFTDDPSLNEQTKARLMAASERINYSRLVVIENRFSEEKLAPGKVYFLNSQKLSKNSLLVRGAPQTELNDRQYPMPEMPPPDDRAQTMWDILRNTIEDEHLTLYLILDEAHRGMKPDRQRATTVQRLINGQNGTPAVPIVMGISATVERFNKAMAQQHGRTMRSSVVVDPGRVQESGLLKDDIRLDFPTEKGTFDTSLLARATRKLRHATDLWQQYSQRDGASQEPVVPLMVVQVPNKSSSEMLALAVATVREEWPVLEADAMANVFGEHQDIEAASVAIRYVPPEKVQDRLHIRVLFAKDAISTGWDCPRAEVFVSFRPATDDTHITQLLGRMVRTPLARRIPGNDVLNSVECVLPEFSQETAKRVARTMTGQRSDDDDGTGGGDGRRVLVAPVDMERNPAVPEVVWAAFDTLPSQTLPRKAARPVIRYTALAQALSRDDLRENAIKEAYGELCKVADGFAARYPEKLEAARKDVLEVSGATLTVALQSGEVTDQDAFVEEADDRAIEADYRSAGRKLTPELARRYADHIAGDEDDDALRDAYITVGALGKIDGIVDVLDKEADKLANDWFDFFRVAIKGLSDERQGAYDAIKGMSVEPKLIDIKRPRLRTEDTKDIDGNPLETRALHLMADSERRFPVANLNEWEMGVLDAEMGRADFLGWYRNPSRPSPDALAVAWKDANDNWRRMCPDFIFFHGKDAKVRASIVDPHGTHLGDALSKLRGLADFAEACGAKLHRIEAVAKVDGEVRVLDLQDAAVRQAVRSAENAERLYTSAVSSRFTTV